MHIPTTTINIRLPAALAEVLKEASRDEERPRSRQVVHYIRRGLRKDGYITEEESDQLRDQC